MLNFKKHVFYAGNEYAQTRHNFQDLVAEKPHILNNFKQQHNLHDDQLSKCYIGLIKLELADEFAYKINSKLKKSSKYQSISITRVTLNI